MNFLRLLLFLGLAHSSMHAFARESLCKSEEFAVFSCSVGVKLVSLCATSDLTDKTGGLYYRFGKKDQVEMVFPEGETDPRAVFVRGGMMYAGGGGDFLRFQRNGYTYMVYSTLGKDWEREGVTVRKDGRLVKELACTTPALIVGEGWGRVYKAKLPIDENRYQDP